jgi:glutaminase
VPSAEVSQRIQQRLDDLHARHQPLGDAQVARYYDPVLGRGYYAPGKMSGEQDLFAMSLATLDGQYFCSGDHDVPFAIQSVSKVFSYGLALADHGRDRVLERVGVEPSGDPFNGIAFDEVNNRPYNPMVNAGAMVTSELVRGIDPKEKLDRILALMRLAAANDSLAVDEATFEGELKISDRNRAIAYLMRNQGMLEGEVEGILGLYLRQCAVAVTCKDLAVMAATLANGCVNHHRRPGASPRSWPRRAQRDVHLRHVRRRGSVDLRRRRPRQERRQRLHHRRHPRQGWHRHLLAGPGRSRQQRSRNQGLPRDVRPARPPRLRGRG